MPYYFKQFTNTFLYKTGGQKLAEFLTENEGKIEIVVLKQVDYWAPGGGSACYNLLYKKND